MDSEKGPVLIPKKPGPPEPTKIRITEDREATGDTAAAYDYWRARSGRTQVPGIIKCFGARPDFLRVQGANDQCVAAIVEGKLDEAPLNAAERALLEYVELVTRAAYRTTADDVQKLRDAGWTEDQIAEAVYVTAMFAFFNRVADAFGVPPQDYLTTGKLTP
jgi:alkylhydroperoxidase family enzyme